MRLGRWIQPAPNDAPWCTSSRMRLSGPIPASSKLNAVGTAEGSRAHSLAGSADAST